MRSVAANPGSICDYCDFVLCAGIVGRLRSIALRLLNKLNQVQGGSYGAILIMGFTFSLTSFTCTAPFVGTLLVLTAQGTWAWPILGMLVFSAAFASPFFFLALFPQSLSALPQSGGWLNSVKVVMGFLELAAALKFLSNVDLVAVGNYFARGLYCGVDPIFLLCGFFVGKDPTARFVLVHCPFVCCE